MRDRLVALEYPVSLGTQRGLARMPLGRTFPAWKWSLRRPRSSQLFTRHQPQGCASAGTAEACEGALSCWTDPVAVFVVALGVGKRREKDVGGVWEAEARIRSQ